MLAYVIYKYVLSLINRPVFNKADILYQEWTASGCSMKNILTRLGGGRGVLRLVVTDNVLWVTSWFPFSLIAPAYDMEHVIPLNWITNIETRHHWMSTHIQLSYADADGAIHLLKLIPKDVGRFLQALGKRT
jgi:hypothetical protein